MPNPAERDEEPRSADESERDAADPHDALDNELGALDAMLDEPSDSSEEDASKSD